MRYLLLFILFSATSSMAAIPDIPFSYYPYDPESCRIITHPSGSQIFIPDNAFIPEGGVNCGGAITIRYREFHSQVDMVIGNIPMDFMQGKKKLHLESGGMFEMYADCDGKPMKPAAGKKIQVRFASKNILPGLSAFFFDGTNGWELLKAPVIDLSYNPGNEFNAELWGDKGPGMNEPGDYYQGEIIDGGEGLYYTIAGNNPKETESFMGMNIARMGLYNYDRILNEEESIPFAADFKIKGEKNSLTSKIYVAYSGLNTVVYYTPDEWEKQFSLLPRSDARIFCMLEDGRVAVLMPSDLEQLNLESIRDRRHTFELVPGDIKPETKEQLAGIAGIQP